MPRISCALCRCKKKGLRRETGRGLFLRKGEIMEILRAANAEIAMRRILQAAVSERRAMSIWNRAVNLSLSGSALTELLQKGTGCPWIWRRDCRCGPKSWAVWTWGKTVFPRTEVFRKSGMKKYRFPSFRDAFGLRGNDRHTDFIGADGFH